VFVITEFVITEFGCTYKAVYYDKGLVMHCLIFALQKNYDLKNEKDFRQDFQLVCKIEQRNIVSEFLMNLGSIEET